MVERVSSLPMYDIPECAAVTDAWWDGLARHFATASVTGLPAVLTRPGEGAAFWLRSDMLFSQACGYPLVTALAGRVSLLATPEYDAPGCDGADYCSLIVVHEDAGWASFRDLCGGTCAVNGADSWSGHHALRLTIAMEGGAGPVPFCNALASGSHAASIATVANGQADFAAVDCVTHATLSRYRPQAVAGTRVLCRSPAMPGLPLIAGQGAAGWEVDAMQQGLAGAMADPDLADVRNALGLAKMHFLPLQVYDRLAETLLEIEDAGITPLL